MGIEPDGIFARSIAWAIACRSRWASGLSFSDSRPFLRLKYIIAVPTFGTGQVS